MSRRAVMFAITDKELNSLLLCGEEDRYDYMSNEIESELFDSPRCIELDKAWEGIQLCLGNGQWLEDNVTPYNIIFGGETLIYDDECIITLKKTSEIRKIIDFLKHNNIIDIIKANYSKIDSNDIDIKLDEDYLNYLIGYTEDILPLYKLALDQDLSVIFTTDF